MNMQLQHIYTAKKLMTEDKISMLVLLKISTGICLGKIIPFRLLLQSPPLLLLHLDTVGIQRQDHSCSTLLR